MVELGHLATGGLFLLPARSPQALGHFVFEYTLIKWPRLAVSASVSILHLGHRIMFIHCCNLLTHEMRIHAKISLPSRTYTHLKHRQDVQLSMRTMRFPRPQTHPEHQVEGEHQVFDAHLSSRQRSHGGA